MPHSTRKRPVIERFWEKVSKTDGCWNWTASTDSVGYGTLEVGRKAVKAHRLSYEMHTGPIPTGMCIMHKCDNRLCVRPDHLVLGTQLENIADRVAKGRNGKPNNKGEVNGQSKLTADQVREMRTMRTSGMGYREIAESFGVKTVAAWSAVTGKTWSHVS